MKGLAFKKKWASRKTIGDRKEKKMQLLRCERKGIEGMEILHRQNDERPIRRHNIFHVKLLGIVSLLLWAKRA